MNLRDMLRTVANPPGEVIVAGADGLKKALELLKAGKDINYEDAGFFSSSAFEICRFSRASS